VALVIGLAVSLAACASPNPIADNLPTSMGGLPANAPARPAVAPEFLRVHDMPQQREAKPLSEEERKQLEADLVAVRARQESININAPTR